MALTNTLSAVSIASLHASDFSLRRSFLIKTSDHHASFFDKRASVLGLSFKIPKNTNIARRIRMGKADVQTAVRVDVSPPVKRSVSPLKLEKEARPPTNLYTAKAPHTATFLSVKMIAPPSDADDRGTYHIIFNHDGFVPHWEGQVFGVMPPPENPYEPGDANTLRFFSVASSRYGDYFNGKTASLCVRRGDSGSTSDFLCSAKPGDKLQITGPTREAMLLGDYKNPNGTHIMVATGTGVAPFRAHLRRFFMEDIPDFNFNGLAWLFAGHRTDATHLYQNEFLEYLSDHPKNFRYDVALSREQTNKRGEKMYVQDTFEDHAEEVFSLLVDGGAYIYLAGRKDIVDPIKSALQEVAEDRHLNWDEIFAQLKRKDQWRVEVY